MLPSFACLLFIAIFQNEYQWPWEWPFKALSSLAAKVLLQIALLFTRIIGGFFYLLLILLFDFPSWLLSFITPSSPSLHQEPEHRHHHHQRRRPKPKDIPEGWVHVLICNTDNISHLDLAKTIERKTTTCEERAAHKVTKEEVYRRVLRWLEEVNEPEFDNLYSLADHDVGRGLSALERSFSEGHVIVDVEHRFLEARRPTSVL